MEPPMNSREKMMKKEVAIITVPEAETGVERGSFLSLSLCFYSCSQINRLFVWRKESLGSEPKGEPKENISIKNPMLK